MMYPINKERYIGWLRMRLVGVSIKQIAAQEFVSPRTIEQGFCKLREEYDAVDSLHLIGILLAHDLLKVEKVPETTDRQFLSRQRNELTVAINKVNMLLTKAIKS
jgi:hypothetical protein